MGGEVGLARASLPFTLKGKKMYRWCMKVHRERRGGEVDCSGNPRLCHCKMFSISGEDEVVLHMGGKLSAVERVAELGPVLGGNGAPFAREKGVY